MLIQMIIGIEFHYQVWINSYATTANKRRNNTTPQPINKTLNTALWQNKAYYKAVIFLYR